MPYKDPEEKRRYMSRYYAQKIKTGEIPCTAYRKRSYGLTKSYTNKTQDSRAAVLAPKGAISRPISSPQAPASSPSKCNPVFILKPADNKPKRPKRRGGAEYRERIPKGFTSLGNGVVMRFIKPGET